MLILSKGVQLMITMIDTGVKQLNMSVKDQVENFHNVFSL